MERQNFSLKVRMMQLKNAALVKLKGKTGAVKRCLVIPVDDNPAIFVGEKDVYLNMMAFEVSNPQYGDSHMLKPNLPKELREKMTQEERDALPILGNMRPSQDSDRTQMSTTATIDASDDEDLPF